MDNTVPESPLDVEPYHPQEIDLFLKKLADQIEWNLDRGILPPEEERAFLDSIQNTLSYVQGLLNPRRRVVADSEAKEKTELRKWMERERTKLELEGVNIEQLDEDVKICEDLMLEIEQNPNKTHWRHPEDKKTSISNVSKLFPNRNHAAAAMDPISLSHIKVSKVYTHNKNKKKHLRKERKKMKDPFLEEKLVSWAKKEIGTSKRLPTKRQLTEKAQAIRAEFPNDVVKRHQLSRKFQDAFFERNKETLDVKAILRGPPSARVLSNADPRLSNKKSQPKSGRSSKTKKKVLPFDHS